MLGAMQVLNADNGQQVRGNAADAGAHVVQQVAELLDVGFAGRVVDGGGATGEDGRHDDIGCARHRSFVEQHVCAAKLLGRDFVDIAPLDVIEAGAKFFETQEMSVQSAASYLVATRFGDDCLAHAGQQRTDHQDRSTQGGAAADESVALQVVEVQLVGLEGEAVACSLWRVGRLHFDSDILQKLNEVVDIANVRDVVDSHLFACQQRGADNL